MPDGITSMTASSSVCDHERRFHTSACQCPLSPLKMTTMVILKEIQLRDAKATLSAVVDDAVRGEPCVITRHGRREAVLVGYEEWQKLSRIPSFGRLLMGGPA